MLLRAAVTLMVAAITTATVAAGVPAALADSPDQQFVHLVHSNGVGGQDDTLIAFAHEFCDAIDNAPMPSGFALYGQGVLPGQLFIVKTAASRVYCPDKIVVPAGPPNVYHGLF